MKKQGKHKYVFYDHLLHHNVTLQARILCLWYSWSSATDFVIFPVCCLTVPVETVRITQSGNKPMVWAHCTNVSVAIYHLPPVKYMTSERSLCRRHMSYIGGGATHAAKWHLHLQVHSNLLLLTVPTKTLVLLKCLLLKLSHTSLF